MSMNPNGLACRGMKATNGNDLILVCILHRLSDLKILDGTGIDVYDNVGQLNPNRCKRLLTINKSVNIERGFTFRRGIPLKGSN